MRLSRKIFVVKKLIKAGKVQRTEILQEIGVNISVLRTLFPLISFAATNIFAALPLSFCSYDIVSKILAF